ncbi:Detected protein of confused Function [Hibiscus syriacus]|uniref:Detected protein of confused Function n=1 Tax=Hibiscus syriacus TaxID=106335 RepID=A0A6A3A662_HIBSY|nr:Detected protein of confused Function [Hibiscus syriacus]
MEFVSPEGLRWDGRRPMEGSVSKANGSAVFEMATPKSLQQCTALERCKIGANSLMTRHWRSTEISLVIRQTMEACILTHLMPRSQIDIFVQADGGTRSACINAATLALADAGIPMRDIVTSCSAGYLNSTPLLDLNYIEDSAVGADVTVGMVPKFDKVTLLQMDAKLPMDIFENVMGLAIEGCKAVANYIREVRYYWRIPSNWSIAGAYKFI